MVIFIIHSQQAYSDIDHYSPNKVLLPEFYYRSKYIQEEA